MPSYDFKPEMSAEELADRFCEEIGNGYGFGLVNFANPDMVGHTGVIPAVVEAVETTDRCLGRVVERVTALGGVCLVTADHGNAEMLIAEDGISRTPRTRPIACRSSSRHPGRFPTTARSPTSPPLFFRSWG